MLIWSVFVMALSSWLWLRRPRRPADFPPGPPPFLIFGNVSETLKIIRSGDVRSAIRSRREQWGDINGIVTPMGWHIVNLSKYEDIKEACRMPELSGRPVIYNILIRSYMKKMGILFNDGHVWSEQRRFALRHLRDLGMGRSSMEQEILAEFDTLREEMERQIGAPMLVNDRFSMVVLNSLWRIIASTRLDSNDPESKKAVDRVNAFFDEIGPQNLLSLAPWLRHVMPRRSGYAALVEHRETFLDMFRRLIREHRSVLAPQAPRDYIDRFLLEMGKDGAGERGFTELGLAINGMDFFIAGLETTATTLNWSLLFMVAHPQIQQRVQQEIDVVLGRRQVSSQDRLRMPYTDATLMEVLRRAAPVSRGVPHSTTLGDVRFRGYVIPKGSIVVMNLEDVHMDAAYWGDPTEFRPERFIAADGSARHDERLVPFGVGRRQCLGESLAKMELFLLFASLLQHFTFSAVPGERLLQDGVVTSLNKPANFHVTYSIRE